MLEEILKAKRRERGITMAQVKTVKTERRLHPRIEHKLPLKIAADGYDFSTSTQNLSCAGVYCQVNRYVPPFTKIAVKMTLPLVSDNKRKEFTLECKGVIVRTEDANNGGFNFAIFFNEITESQRKKIAQYISQLLPK